MKKKLILLLLFTCLLTFGCTKEKVEPTFNNKSTIDNSMVNELFEKASKDYGGVTFKPIALLGTQIVAGTNYMFLVEATSINDKPITTWRIVIIYKDLSDNATITKAEEIDPNDYFMKDNTIEQEEITGGWSYNESIEGVTLSNEDAQKAFDKATKNLTGTTYFPVTLLGTTKDSYLVLSKKTLVLKEPVTMLSILTIKNNKIVNTYDLDLSSYNK